MKRNIILLLFVLSAIRGEAQFRKGWTIGSSTYVFKNYIVSDGFIPLESENVIIQ